MIIAWLFVTLMMALTMRNGWGGIAFFLSVGLAPVALYASLALRRLRARPQPHPRSALEGQVKATDDGNA